MKLDIVFRKNSDELMTSWEIGNFLEKFGSYYYKISVIEELKTKLEIGIRPNDVFIMSNSFNTTLQIIYDTKSLNSLSLTSSSRVIGFSLLCSVSNKLLKINSLCNSKPRAYLIS